MAKKIFLAIIILLALTILSFYLWSLSKGGVRSVVVQKVAEKVISDPVEQNMVTKSLGFEKPQTYLVLFLNNTEIRPGGGFIGAYGVVRVDKGIPEILKVEGTEILDNNANPNLLPTPPKALEEYLGIKKWAFRDSNWSPDFVLSSIQSLDLFKKENGISANEISGVIGITPTLMEEILKISGPIVIDGQEFNSQNFTEKLEYEVEFGFNDKGLDFDQRKKILVDLSHVVLAKMKTDIFKQWPKYFALSQRMFSEKHILAYSTNPEMQKVLIARGWAGEVKNSVGDYVLWADANLGALKTDKVMDKEITYSFAPTGTDRYVGTIKMKYNNTGSFTKFTTRYRTYARLFLPFGTEFISVAGSMKADKSKEPAPVDRGIEKEKQWFGTFISIEPGQTKELIWQFYLSPSIVSQIKNGSYNLYAQKELGTVGDKLTLDFNFAKNITFANPSEDVKFIGDQKYNYKTDLRVDRNFQVNLK